MGEDLDRVLKDFHRYVEVASTEFSQDLKETLGSHFHGLLSNQIEVLIERLVQRISLGTVTPLAQLDAARLSLETFLGQQLQELNSQWESKILVAELSRRLSEHKSRIWTLVQAPELSQGGGGFPSDGRTFRLPLYGSRLLLWHPGGDSGQLGFVSAWSD